jgi:hypothetical protein
MPQTTPRPAADAADGALALTKNAGEAVVSTARRTPAPALAAGAAAAGIAGGLALATRLGSRRALQRLLPLPRRSRARALAGRAKRLAVLANQASNTADDIRAIREQLEQTNRRSPIEVVLDGLTHRRGAHKLER